MTFLKILIPSWRFFDRAGDTAILYVRTKEHDSKFSDWKPCLRKPERNLTHLFLNAQGNLYLACQGLVDRLVQEMDPASIETQEAFVLVKSLVENSLEKLGIIYQFKVDVIPANGEQTYAAVTSQEYILK